MLITGIHCFPEKRKKKIIMSPFDILTLFGGLAMFLYGMRLMGDGLKQGSSGTLKVIMEKATSNPVKALILGTAVTAIIQSSTATIVITAGLVAAGIMTLHQSMGIIIGANIGTTVTGQIIRLLDIDSSAAAWLQIFKPSSLAPIALILGIIVIMAKSFRHSKTLGDVMIGFGILFSGLLNMTGAVDALTRSGVLENLLTGLGNNPLMGYLTGVGVSFVLQSSSATIGILQAFSASGVLTFQAVYPVIVGVYLGDCVTTGIVCSIGQKPEARRTGIVNILYNLCKSVLVLSVVALLHRMGFLGSLWSTTVNSGIIADANTIFNLSCALLLFPIRGLFEKLSYVIVKSEKESENPYKDKLDALNPAFFRTPAIALNSCYDLLLTQFRAARDNIRRSFNLLDHYDEKLRQKIDDEEKNIDLLTDQVNKYMVELLPSLQVEYQVGILNQYYKVVTDFERLGDHAVNIADCADRLREGGVSFSPYAMSELGVMQEILEKIMEYSEEAFEHRNVEAAYRIEPLADVTEQLIRSMKMNHLQRMVAGKCNVFADVSFTNLFTDLQRIAKTCSNVGGATIVRANPQLADHEHDYYSSMRSGRDEQFNRQYKEAYEYYSRRMEEAKAAAEAETKNAAAASAT